MKRTIISILIYIGLQILVSLFVAMVAGVISVAQGGDVASVAQSATVLGISSLLANVIAIIVLLKLRYANFSFGHMRSSDIMPALVIAAVLALAMVLPLSWLSDSLELPDFLKNEFTASMSDFWAIIAISLVAPVAEEILFRGAIQGALQKIMKPKWAIFLSALIFGLIHFNPVQVCGAFLMGLVFAWLYYRTGSVWPGIVAHATNNIVSTILGQFYPVDASLAEITGGGTPMYALLAVSMIVFVAVICYGKKTLPLPDNAENVC